MLQIQHLLDRRPARSRAASASAWRWAGRWRATRSCFLFDEPLSNLDAKLRVEMRAEIKRLHQVSGITSVYVTHDQIEAMTLGTRIAVMKDGILQQIGTPDEIYRLPANTYVAGFIGSPTMNFIAGSASGTGASGQFGFEGGSLGCLARCKARSRWANAQSTSTWPTTPTGAARSRW
jgi:multiple sugar transport system ATP-binding protein